jgi:MOSC domain-containing protein YiiM
MTGRVFQLSRSPGGVPKLAVREVRVETLGLDGDEHAHPKHHGGPERAVCLFSLEVIQRLQAEGHPIYPGSTGENVTVSGLDWPSLTSGTRLELGDKVLIEITRAAEPCKIIAASFANGDTKRIHVDEHPGESRLYARVLREGLVRVGQAVRVV